MKVHFAGESSPDVTDRAAGESLPPFSSRGALLPLNTPKVAVTAHRGARQGSLDMGAPTGLRAIVNFALLPPILQLPLFLWGKTRTENP